MQVIPQGQLLHKAWLPYNNSRPLTFWMSAIHQMMGQVFSAAFNCSYDVVIVTLMINISAQFTILEHRFEVLPKVIQSDIQQTRLTAKTEEDYKYGILRIETIRLADCLRHHSLIFEFNG
uniref:Uncharacterized protein n=1 Tax=Bracon brevicornis TaxID=1563983 RepID=A0A6V7KP59_9HYME